MSRKKYLLLFSALLLIQSSIAITAKNLVNEETSVPVLSFKSYYLNIETDYLTIKLSINVYLGDITVGVLDETNYNIWTGGSNAQSYFTRYDIMSGDYEIELGPAGIYYIVLDNSDSLFLPAQLRITVSISTVGETIGIVIGSVIGLAILIFIMTRTHRSRKIQQTQQYQLPIVQTPDTVIYTNQLSQQTTVKTEDTMFCSNCGRKVKKTARFCEGCGFNLID